MRICRAAPIAQAVADLPTEDITQRLIGSNYAQQKKKDGEKEEEKAEGAGRKNKKEEEENTSNAFNFQN